MGLRLKSQLLALCLALMLLSLGSLSYFHLTISSRDNMVQSDLAGRRTAALAFQQIQVFVRASPLSKDLNRCFALGNTQALRESLMQSGDVLEFHVFDRRGLHLLGSCPYQDNGLQFEQALAWVNSHREILCEVWGDHQGQSERLFSVAPFYNGRVVHHSYHPLYDDQGQLQGLVHLVVQLPKANLYINLIVLGYLTVAAIFLVSSLLAIYMWAEFALNRPLRGLSESLRQLRSLDPTRHQDLAQPNELSEAARALNHVTLDLVKYQQELTQKTQRLQELNEELEQKVADKTLQMREFFSLITHDLRIPLAAVAGYAELMQKPRSGDLTEKQLKLLHNIVKANGSAQDLVFNLLEAMKYEFGQPALQPESFDLRELVNEIQNQLAPENKPIEVVADPAGNYLVWGDRQRLGRVFSNLLGNALHHAGEVRVDLSDQKGQVGVVVSDRGPGIPAEELPNLFEKFKASSTGLGLGLYIVQRILKDHGQEIQVDSRLGEGTRFSFALCRTEQKGKA